VGFPEATSGLISVLSCITVHNSLY